MAVDKVQEVSTVDPGGVPGRDAERSHDGKFHAVD
jgi:hypothetical protein